MVNTGLDMVVRVTPEGRVLEEWDVLLEPAWQRFSRDIDYRKIVSTKPHRSHPNFVFELGDEVWVTRFEQRDAICLTAPQKRRRRVRWGPRKPLRSTVLLCRGDVAAFWMKQGARHLVPRADARIQTARIRFRTALSAPAGRPEAIQKAMTASRYVDAPMVMQARGFPARD